MDDYINKIADCRYCGAQYTVEEFESFVKFEDLPKKKQRKIYKLYRNCRVCPKCNVCMVKIVNYYGDRLAYCPICGEFSRIFKGTCIEGFSDNICRRCKNYITPQISLHEWSYYSDKAEERYGDAYYNDMIGKDREILIEEEVKYNPLFNPNTTEHNAAEAFEKRERIAKQRFQEGLRLANLKASLPECPTCHSTDVKRISDARKVAGALMFGIFSKTAKSQFQCNNCGYKW